MRLLVLASALSLLQPAVPPGTPAAPQPTLADRALVKEISEVRVRPRAYAKVLRERRTWFDGTLWKRPGRTPLRTEEGLAALDEAIAFLENAKPVGPLRFNEGLALAARRHAEDLAAHSTLSHTGADGSRLSDRLNRLGTWHGLIAEAIGTLEEDPREVVIQLLVDDGVPDRGHRRNLFHPELHQAGAASVPHPTDRVVTVIDFADGFVPQP